MNVKSRDEEYLNVLLPEKYESAKKKKVPLNDQVVKRFFGQAGH